MMKIINPNSFSEKLNFDEDIKEEELITYFKKVASEIRKGVNTDIEKALKEGKPIIIEGYEIIPDIYV